MTAGGAPPRAAARLPESDVGSPLESLVPWRALGIRLLAPCLTLYAVVEILYLFLPPLVELAVFLGASLALAFFKFPVSRNDRAGWLDLLCVALAGVVTAYVVLQHDALLVRIGAPTSLDVAVSVAGTLLVLEAARRTVGWILPALGLLAIAYAAFGRVLPTALGGHGGFGWERIITDIYLTEQGIYGFALTIMFRLVILFVLFGTLLAATGGIGFLIDLSQSLFGRFTGGPAKVAVIASGLFGTISGSAVANVMVDGWITIPMMKRAGFAAHVAGGVEAAASTGGQLMPPVMGSAAFMMIQYVGQSYLAIIKAAAIPGILYYLALYAAVHFYAVRYGLAGFAPQAPLAASDLLKRGLVFFGPLVVLTWALFYYSPHMSVLVATGALVVVSFFQRASRLNPGKAVGALREAALDAVPTVTASASVGVVIATVMLTGLGLRLPDLILGLAGNQLFVVLLLVMVTSIILGMGLPTVVCYLLLATIMAPALVRMGVTPMAAHLFILYFGMLSMVTPPVALAAYAAGGIAEADLMRTGFAAWKLALSGFIVPFMFVYDSSLLLDGSPFRVATSFLSASAGVILLGASLMGYFLAEARLWERAALFAGSVLLIHVGWVTDLVGLGLAALVALSQWPRAGTAARRRGAGAVPGA